jgi:hypothetical protein
MSNPNIALRISEIIEETIHKDFPTEVIEENDVSKGENDRKTYLLLKVMV